MNVLHTDGTVLIERAVTGLHKCHGTQVFAAGNLRSACFGETVEQLSHGALKRIGEPSLGPLGLDPDAGLFFSRESNCAGHGVRVTGPTNGAACEPVGAFNAPPDVIVVGGAFADGSGPDVVAGGCPKAV